MVAKKLGEVLTKEALKQKNLWVLIRDTVTDMTTGLPKTMWRIRRGKDVPDDQIGNIAASLTSSKKPGKRKFLTPKGTLKPKVGPGGVANPGSRKVFRDLLGNPKAREVMRDRERFGLGTGASIAAISTALGLSLADSEDFIDFYEMMENAARELKYVGPRPDLRAMSVTPTDDDDKGKSRTDIQLAQARRMAAIPPKPIDPSLDPDIAQEPGFGFGIDQLRIDKEEKAIRREAFESRLGQDMLEAAKASQGSLSSGLGERPSPDLRRRTSPTLEDRAEDMLGRLLGLSRSKSEIERDTAYTQLKEEELLGLQPDTRTQFEVADKVYSDPNEYWDAWNANRKAELDGGDEKKSGGRVLKKKVKKKVSRSYKPKSTKKQYAKNNSVRKPKRI